ncbi:MAG: hypothetical protein H6Q20_917 [Bacteroidetes bacterium]|nr:hypothetical protein [Bacteroidota bacterium]
MKQAIKNISFTLLCIVLMMFTADAQNAVSGYEYWFDSDYTAAVRTGISGNSPAYNLEADFSTANLLAGVHSLNIRFKDQSGMWSITLSHFFFKTEAVDVPNRKIKGYEYWFDQNYDSVVKVAAVQSSADLLFDLQLTTNSLSAGVHVINFRFLDDSGLFSSVQSNFFYKTEQNQIFNNHIAAYEYWFDNEYANVIKNDLTTGSDYLLNIPLVPGNLPVGLHVLNIRFKDTEGLWSSPQNHFFYNAPVLGTSSGNKITEWRYWVNDDFVNKTEVKLENPVAQFVLSDNFDFSKVQAADYVVNFQFKDSANVWSAVLTDTIQKVALPLADFSYATNSNCDSTVVEFTDKSVDGNKYLWSFGDNQSDTIANPTHVFYTPGSYTVDYTVSDKVTMTGHTISKTLTISGNTFNSLSVTECRSMISPSGKYTYSATGVYHDTVPNSWGCDSLLTINFTALSVDKSVTQTGLILTANEQGATYQWLDCANGNSSIDNADMQSFAPAVSGNYAVEIMKNGCRDTSACYTVTVPVNGVSDNDVVPLSIYPNPAKEYITVDMSKEYNKFRISISSVQGQLIRIVDVADCRLAKVSLSDLPQGIYLLTIVTEKQKKLFRVLKE